MLVLLAAAAVGCSSDVPLATPDVARSTPPPPGQTAAADPSDLPDESEPGSPTIDLVGKDPCSAVPDAALAAVGSEPARSVSDRTGSSELGCSYLDFDSPYGSALFFDTGAGYEKFGHGGIGVITRPITVQGLPAFAAEKPSRAGCTVGVDVAPGQSLSVSTIGSFDEPTAPLCDRAAEFASTAIAALHAG